MCRVLHLSESGYYRWLRNRGRHSSRQLLAGKVKKILEEHPDNRNYGVDRVCLALEQDGVDVSRRTVYRVMKENGWLHKRRIPHGITKTTTEAQEQENLLKRDFSAQRPLEKFLTDITEVQCADGKLYVSPIMDCFNGEIVALEMRDNMKKELCIDTVRQLERLYPSLSGAVFHSDRGSQYTSLAPAAICTICPNSSDAWPAAPPAGSLDMRPVHCRQVTEPAAILLPRDIARRFKWLPAVQTLQRLPFLLMGMRRG